VASYKVGLTGGLASGKSVVARRLARAGFTVVDADRLVADLYRAHAPGSAAVAQLFGRSFLDADGAVDKAALAQRVFADPEARRQLEEVIHPLVRKRFAGLAAAGESVAVLEATLLVEAGYAPDFDVVVTVEAPAETRLRRAVARGLDEADARARLAAQGDGEARRRAAEITIANDGDLTSLEAQADRLAKELRRRAFAATMKRTIAGGGGLGTRKPEEG
jgi:dephospho-CoA kinase